MRGCVDVFGGGGWGEGLLSGQNLSSMTEVIGQQYLRVIKLRYD